LVLVAVLQLAAFLWQGWLVKRSVDLAEKGTDAAIESADAATKSSNAATATIRLMRQTARRELRARMFVLSAKGAETLTTGRSMPRLRKPGTDGTFPNFPGITSSHSATYTRRKIMLDK
jgi:hypothetical protein